MARDFGTVPTNFWSDPYARRLSADAVLLYFYLRTSPHSSAANAYVLQLPYIVHDIRMDQERIARALRDLATKPFILYDPTWSVVFLPGVLGQKGARIQNANVAKMIAETLLGLPNCELKAKAIEDFRGHCTYSDVFKNVLGQWRYDENQTMLALGGESQGELLSDEPPEKPRSAPKPAAKDKVLRTRLPADWTLPDNYRAWAVTKGFPTGQIDTEAKRFFAHFTGDDAKEPAKKNWFQAWQNWMDRVTPRKVNGNGNGAHGPVNGGNGHADNGPDDPRWPLRLSEWNKTRYWIPAQWGPEPGKPGCKVPPELLAPH